MKILTGSKLRVHEFLEKWIDNKWDEKTKDQFEVDLHSVLHTERNREKEFRLECIKKGSTLINRN